MHALQCRLESRPGCVNPFGRCWCAFSSPAHTRMSRYPSHLSPNITPTKSQKSRARREPSGVFSLFQPQQIQQFKEAFSLIDQDRDGLVGERDLKDTFASLGAWPHAKMPWLRAHFFRGEGGVQPSSENTRDRGINFAMFLTMMSEHLFEFDAEAELLEAFSSFDESDSGTVKCDEMRKWLSETGDRMNQAEIDRFLKGSFTDRQRNFNYKEWVKVLRVNEDDNGAEVQA
ncbi:EF-hand [Lactarius hengduanensis]|nr:EF-hand [Lactarius hengduanensis]